MSDDRSSVDSEISPDARAGSQIEEHVKSRSTWLRFLFMLVFCVLVGVASLVGTVVVVLGFLWVLFTGEPNRRLVNAGQSIAMYVYEIVRYLTFNTDIRPFPFDADWPSAADGPGSAE